ncbi:PREDICTED: beta-glucosidase [Prunus dulcis]|uniref:PREDICTED: beta-glucosidase n=1 Tax=Prunus dulcis TaxID=3755 RepID=A0A5E4F7L6_PRUDU|nr:PREDICTED: beta-glucosidase [Prunus dulcis]
MDFSLPWSRILQGMCAVVLFACLTQGSAKEAGRGPSVWDYYVEKFPERIADHSNMFTALDSYKRYKVHCKRSL